MRPHSPSPRPRNRGISLVITLWLVAVLTAFLTVTLTIIFTHSEDSIAETHSYRAWQLAHQGLSYASHPLIERDDPLLTFQDPEFDESFTTTIAPEATRLNPNFILSQKDDELLFNLLLDWGLADSDAESLIAALTDWIDTNDLEELNGAENDYYAELGQLDRPFNRPFQNLNELRLVRGFAQLESLRPDWRDFFTVHSTGPLDIHETSIDLLIAAAETDETSADSFRSLVLGDDQLMGTEDDTRFPDINLALDQLTSPPDRRDFIIQRFQIEGSISRIESTGRSGKYQTRITSVIAKENNAITLLNYQESTHLAPDASHTANY